MPITMKALQIVCVCLAVSQALKLVDEASPMSRQAILPEKPAKISSACVCGTPNKVRYSSRLINGVAANPNSKYPFMAIIKVDDTYICAGTLISDQFVLTTASCVDNRDPSKTTVQLGVNSGTAGAGNKYETVGVTKFIPHGSFNKTKIIPIFDIALVRLKTAVKIGGNISPICLPIENNIFINDGLKAKTAGWESNGTTSTSGVVQELNMTAISTENCQRTSYNDSIIKEMLCVKNATGGSGLESRDFGAPFFDQRKGSFVQLGVAFYQRGNKLPGVYTYLRTFVRWIYSKTTHSNFCSNPIVQY